MFAGSLQGVTQTLSLAIYEQFDVDFDTALAIGAELVVVSAAILLSVKLVPDGDAHPRPRPRSSVLPLRLALEVGAETVALVGPSGAGKSSVLRAVAGLLRPDRGRIALGDHVWLDAERRLDVPPERRPVGLVFQEYALFPHLSVRANVAFGGRQRVDELLERFRIAHLADARPRRSRAASGSASRSRARSHATARPPPRRAALGARRAHARRRARRAARAPARPRPADGARHTRLRGCCRARRPRRRARRGPHPPACAAGRSRRRARRRVRGELHRREPPSRRRLAGARRPDARRARRAAAKRSRPTRARARWRWPSTRGR